LAGHEPVELAAPPLQLKIRSGTLGPRIEPAEAALRRGHTIELMNATDARHVVSMPAEDAVHGLDPGAVVQISLAQPGPHRIYLLDVASAESLVFAAPGRFTVPRPTGEYALADLAPGAARVHVWHPRFPPSSSAVELRADTITPLDLVLGVGLGGPRTDSTGAGR
ncbi:MAG: carboxypeptidase-like regulatory domain-containing protein, partial [Actinomycetota bacterium]|nr:carboxypeptidase-like regulatory domain-containing protein [Actinomycetota bacterium]